MTVEIIEAAPDADVPGGSSFLADALTHDDEVDSDATQVLQSVAWPMDPELEPNPPRRSWYRRALSVLCRALACVRESVDRLTSGIDVATRRWVYSGRHHIVKPVGHRVRTTPLGRDRSTSEYSRAVQRRTREAADQEGDLADYFRPGDTFVDWWTATHESLRRAQFNRKYLPAHGEWLCS